MDGSNSDAARDDAPATDEAPLAEARYDPGQSQADRVAEGLRDQIAALRRQVKDAQETLLRDQTLRRDEARTFKD